MQIVISGVNKHVKIVWKSIKKSKKRWFDKVFKFM